jgi:ATP-binding cassette, subfamily B, bacterial
MAEAMTAPSAESDSARLKAALRQVLRRYYGQIRARPALAIPALILPGIGDLLIFYAPPLVIARLLGAFARNETLSAAELTPYVLAMTGCWLAGEAVWRVAGFLIARTEIRGMEALYVEAMRELLAKDLQFFQSNYAGSLTKRALGFARRFEDVFDVLSFSLVANTLPLCFVIVILWSYSPLLIATLLGMLALTMVLVVPRIRRRQALVDVREAASNVLAGHVADSIANAEAVRAFAREPDEARIHARNVSDFGAKTLRSWDYQNLRVDTITAPMFVLTNALGLVVALATSSGTGASLEVVFLTFSYYAAVTRVMWEFNRIYRNLESALTDAAQFTELLLDPPSIVDPSRPQTFEPAHYGVEMSNISFRHHATGPWLFDRFSLAVAPSAKVGLVGHSGGGKTTLTRLLMRFADVERGQILIGGQPIDRVPQSSLRRAIAYVPQDPGDVPPHHRGQHPDWPP